MELTAENRKTLDEALCAWHDELLCHPQVYASAAYVRDALYRICSQVKSTQLPTRLEHLCQDANKQAVIEKKSHESSGYATSRLLEDIREARISIARTAIRSLIHDLRPEKACTNVEYLL